VECANEPDVPVTVMVYVPAGSAAATIFVASAAARSGENQAREQQADRNPCANFRVLPFFRSQTHTRHQYGIATEAQMLMRFIEESPFC
jgi:hypothetical protein